MATNDFTWAKQPYQLAIEATCPKCAHKSDIVNGIPSGPHCKGLCQKCGAYIKFLGKNDLRLRKQGEDRATNRLPVTIAHVTKYDGLGSTTEILFVGDGDLAKDAEKAHGIADKFDYCNRGMKVEVDRIAGSFEKDQTPRSKVVCKP